jgi:hypothetical protein
MANTLFLERIAEEGILRSLSRDDLLLKLKTDCGLECNPHTKKRYLIQAILDYKYGGNDENEEEVQSKSSFDKGRNIESL